MMEGAAQRGAGYHPGDYYKGVVGRVDQYYDDEYYSGEYYYGKHASKGNHVAFLKIAIKIVTQEQGQQVRTIYS